MRTVTDAFTESPGDGLFSKYGVYCTSNRFSMTSEANRSSCGCQPIVSPNRS
jgi:hypothetical protein